MNFFKTLFGGVGVINDDRLDERVLQSWNVPWDQLEIFGEHVKNPKAAARAAAGLREAVETLDLPVVILMSESIPIGVDPGTGRPVLWNLAIWVRWPAVGGARATLQALINQVLGEAEGTGRLSYNWSEIMAGEALQGLADFHAWRCNFRRPPSPQWTATIKLFHAIPRSPTFTLDGSKAAFSPDGKRIATAGYGIILWDPATGEMQCIVGKSFPSCFALSADGRHVVTVPRSADKEAEVWDIATNSLKATLAGHKDSIWRTAFSPDGTKIVTASDDGTAQVWETATGRSLTVYRGHDGGVRQAVFFPDGRRIATATLGVPERGKVHLWEADTGKTLKRLSLDSERIMSIALSTDGSRLLAGIDDICKTPATQLLIWDLGEDREIARLLGHTSGCPIMAVAFSPDGRLALSGGYDSTCRLWEVGAGKELLQMSLPQLARANCVNSVGFSADGTRLLVATASDAKTRIWTTTLHTG